MVAPFLVGLTAFSAMFQGVAKAMRPAGTDKGDVYGKWIDAFASMTGGAVMFAVFGAWAWSNGLRPTPWGVCLVGLLILVLGIVVWCLGHRELKRNRKALPGVVQ